MANKTLYLPITAPEDYLPSFMEAYAKSVGWQEGYSQNAMEYSASHIRKMILNGIAQQNAKEAADAAAKAAHDAVQDILLSVEQEAVPPLE